jgi:hypothetical protein
MRLSTQRVISILGKSLLPLIRLSVWLLLMKILDWQDFCGRADIMWRPQGYYAGSCLDAHLGHTG